MMLDLTRGLSERGHRCDMLCAATKSSYTLDINSLSSIFAVRSLAKVKATMLSPAMISRLRRIAKDYDIIHVHHPDPMAALALRLSGYKGRVVLHWHSDILRQRMLLRLIRPLQSWLLRRADAVVGTSPVYLARSPWLSNVQGKCRCIPIGIDPVATPDPAVTETLRKRFNGHRIVFAMGRLVSYKGFEYLIDSAAMLPDDMVVVIGGTGPLETSLRRRISDGGLTSKVILEGYIPDDFLPTYYHAATVFCMPSVERTEAFGVVQIEAMSCGTPVVATDIPGSGVPWVNAHGISGLNVPPRDARKLAEAIVEVADKADTLYGPGAKRHFSENFTFGAMLDAVERLYVDITAKI